MAFHFTGIKGTGMAALACILHDEHQEVKGSDIEKRIFTQEGLEARGIPIYPFDPANIQDGDQVIVGLSFGKDHPEVKAALENPTVSVCWYNDYLGKLLERYESICVAGTHGKSTTTGLLASVLELDCPTGYLIGDGHGHMPEDAKRFVLESCEFQRHFLAYHPDVAIITNAELDHIDYYKDMDDYLDAFASFAKQIKKLAVICGDDPHLKSLPFQVPVVTYGLDEGNDYRAVHVKDDDSGISYDVLHDGIQVGTVSLSQTGYPFVINSLGVFALAHSLGMKPEVIAQGLADFQGIARRFVVETIQDEVLVDDYAHHPTAIARMIEAARLRWPDKQVVALYKPDRYSRLQFFLDRFAQSLSLADKAYLLDFPANAKREDDTVIVTIQDLRSRIEGAELLAIDDESAKRLAQHRNSVFLFMSSKDIYLLKDKLADILRG
jgi:UDP-N-acetylmuramate--alanine ligase